jgi:Uncharacterized conserved protein (DUF2304)
VTRLTGFLALVALVMAVVVLEFVRTRRLRAKYALLWIAIAVGGLAGVALLAPINWLADRIGVTGPSLFLLGVVVLAVTLGMMLTLHLTRLEQRSERLAEEVALLRRRLDDQRG